MPDINKLFEAKLEKLIKAYSKRIQQIYYNSIEEISLFSALASGSEIQLSQTIFNLFPALKIKLDSIMQQMHDGIYQNVAASISDSWLLSNLKNDKISNDVLGDLDISEKIKDLVYNRNADALEAFINRKTQGLNLSDRVWNLVEPYSYELEAGLTDGIGKGKSAAEMATDMKRYLKEPDKLFRRVRDENGVFQLSKTARDYSPGQGVYRSSYQNALRLTGTETNIAYRSSDHERWNKQPFTKGIEVKVSNNHPEYDICDEMKGQYPKDFKFTGWHPRCRCYATPVLVSDEEFNQQEDVLLGISSEEPEINEVDSMPDKAKEWVRNNAERINGWSNKPYWAKDNTRYINPLLKKKHA